VNVSLIWLNIVVFLYELSLGPQLEPFLRRFGVVPEAMLHGGSPLGWVPLFTSMFLHGGWGHILGNLWFLWIFGDNVEDRMGPKRYLVFYLVCGLVANLVHILINPSSTVPTIGASGAISGVLGAYFVLFPYARVMAFIPLWFFFFDIVEVPAFFFLGLWFLMQFYSGLIMLPLSRLLQTGGVAWWAHIGGFAAGVVLVKLFCARRPYRRWYADEYRVF
jgi:membrane associated rhomboid family serine protease